MDKRVILAVAGAGKTYHLCNSIDPAKKNLIIAYTNENIHNIQNELIKTYGAVPELTTVTTFDSFVYHSIILPYEPSIASFFSEPTFVSNGISMADPPPQRIRNSRGMPISNPGYTPKNKLGHYINSIGQYYCDNLSELVMHVKRKDNNLILRASKRLNYLFDAVLIDEFQDFREYDYELIVSLSKKLNHILLVGDFYQHSVSGKNNSGKPFKNRKGDVIYTDFIKELTTQGFSIDTTSLVKSRRCSLDVCNFVTQKLGIPILSFDGHNGSVIWINEKPSDILDNKNIVKLIYSGSRNYSFRAINWSYSKGDTFDEVCVILTEDFETLDKASFTTNGISTSTINKLYVAMTRSRGNLYLIKASEFKKVKTKYRNS